MAVLMFLLLRLGVLLPLGVHPDGADDLGLGGLVVHHVPGHPGHSHGGLHIFGDLPEGGVLAVQMGGGLHHDEELAAGAVRVHGPGHGQHAQGVLDVVLLKAVAGELPPDLVAGTTGTGAAGAAALDHEAGDDPVEGQAVIEAAVGQGDEVVHGVGGLLRVQLPPHNLTIFQLDGDDGIAHVSNLLVCVLKNQRL